MLTYLCDVLSEGVLTTLQGCVRIYYVREWTEKLNSKLRQKVTLKLSNHGGEFTGELIGAPLRTSGEFVFTTGMVGYSEALTDPSYFGQILLFSYPLIGNYGIPDLPKNIASNDLIPSGFESEKVTVAGVIVTFDSAEIFHWNSLHSLDRWLKDQNVPGIVGLDTRHLVQVIRTGQHPLGIIEPQDFSGDRINGKIITTNGKNDLEWFDPNTKPILDFVSVKEPRRIGKGAIRIGVVDCGVKWNILRQLVEQGCEVELVPWNYDLRKVDCAGWLISNGPGDPLKTESLVQGVRDLIANDQRPLLGICLGHQILALAAGAKTHKMPYGHRSHNQPVYEVGTRRGYITSQNHGFVVDAKTLSPEWLPWFRNVNDDSIEGLKHISKPIMSVQFHPEAAGGPRDTGWIMDRFVAGVMR